MPPEKGKESQKGRNRIKESQKGRRRKGPDCLQSQLKTQKRKEFCKFQKNEKCSFFLFPVYATGPYRAPVRKPRQAGKVGVHSNYIILSSIT